MGALDVPDQDVQHLIVALRRSKCICITDKSRFVIMTNKFIAGLYMLWGNLAMSWPEPNPNCIEVDDTAFSVETVHKTVLPKNTLTFVEVSTKMNANIGFFKCKENNTFMNSNLL